MEFCWYQLLAVSAPILLDIAVSEYYPILPKKHNITQDYQYYSISLILLNITNITQYYQYYSILLANMILEWSRIVLGYYSMVSIGYQYYSILPILPVLHNFTNITQYYTSKIHHYYPIFLFQYYSESIFHWWYSISILLNITNITQYYLFNITQYSQTSKLCFSNWICVNIHQYYKPFPIFINIPQYFLSILQMAAALSGPCRLSAGRARRRHGGTVSLRLAVTVQCVFGPSLRLPADRRVSIWNLGSGYIAYTGAI